MICAAAHVSLITGLLDYCGLMIEYHGDNYFNLSLVSYLLPIYGTCANYSPRCDIPSGAILFAERNFIKKME